METIERNDRVRDAILQRLKSIDSGRFVRELEDRSDADLLGRRRITEYTNGITRWRRWLDFLIDHWARAGAGIHPVVRNVLRIGAYELVILNRPDHAVVNASVEQAKRVMRGGRSSAFVNAILRQIGRNAATLPAPASGNSAEDLAIRYSHPTWMVARWLDRFGRDETEQLLEWNNSRPRFGLRVNTLITDLDAVESKLVGLGVESERGRFAADFLHVDTLQPVLGAGLVESGAVAIQDEGAGLVVDLLDPEPNQFVVDACAAPGGKLIRAGILMKNEGKIVAIDPNKARLEMAADAAARHKLSIVEFWTGSFNDWSPGPRQPDAILLDVPCSGLGVLARRADLRWRKKPDDVGRLTRLQDRLLDHAADMVRPGGILAYSTCTIEPEENEARVNAFLARHPGFTIDPGGSRTGNDLTTGDGFLATLPHRHGVDGVFAARLRKGN